MLITEEVKVTIVHMPHCTHLNGIWNKQGLLRNWDKGFSLLFLESKAKFTLPYPSSPLPPAREKGLRSSFPFMGLTTFGASSALLWTRPSLLPVAGEGVGKEEVICLRPCEVPEHLSAAGLPASLSNLGPSRAHSRRGQSSPRDTGWHLIPALLPA